MKKVKKTALRILAILLIGTILLSDGTTIKAFASDVNTVGTDSGNGENTGGNTENNGGENEGGENTGDGNGGDENSGDENEGGEGTGDGNGGDENSGDENEEDGNGGENAGDEGENTGGNNGEETGDRDEENSGENPGEDTDEDNPDENGEGESEDNELEEEVPVEPEDEIDGEEDSTGKEEHLHTWVREEGEIYPVCTECGEFYFDEDCDPEAGIGIHIFELIQEEGQEDRFRCVICGFEKDFLEEWDLTVELYLLIDGIETYSFTYGGETSSLPATLLELQQAEANGYYAEKTFSVKNLADLMALQSLSKEFSFEGYTIVFVGREDPDGIGALRRWDLTPLKNSYKGLGTAEFPFKGTLRTFYADNSLYFETNTPLLNYVATGARVYDFQISADINSESGDPVGIIAAHVVKDDEYDSVNLGNLILSGTVRNSQGAAGVIFGEADADGDQPIRLTCQADANITMSAGVTAQNAGGIIGKTTGNIEVYTVNPLTTGEINGSESSGMLAGSMEEGKLCLEDGEIRANVNGSGTSGGLVGIIKNGKIEGAEEGKTLTVSGNIKGTVAAGGLVGRCETTDTQVKNLVISASVAGSSMNVNNGSAVGGVIGKYISSHPAGGGQYDGNYDLIDQVSVSGPIDVGRAIGGVIGEIEGSNIRIGDPESGFVSVTGNINASLPDAGAANGGVVGIATGQYIEVYHAQVSNVIRRAASIGGIFGIVGDGSETDRSIVKVKDVTIEATIEQPNASTTRGGIFGTVKKGSMAALDGAIHVNLSYNFSLQSSNNHVETGYIAGKQTEALIYLETEAVYNRTEKAWKDDIGSYGGVYRNGNWGEGNLLISYAEKGVTGLVGQSGGAWLLDTEADVIRLAIVLNTAGRFAGSCFSEAGKSSLLDADYQLTANKTYELTDSGIYSLNRNDDTGCNEVFSGSIDGSGAVLRMGSYDTYQKYVALFPCVGNGAEFSNFTLEGKDGGPRKIQYAKGGAGLAVYGRNDVTVSNVGINTDLTGNSLNTAYLYGGMIAVYSAGTGTLTVEETSISGNITINQNNAGNLNQKQYAGGMIAQYDGNPGSRIKIDQLSLNQQITSNSRYTSGMITRINSQNTNTDKTILDISGIKILNGSSLTITDGSNIGNDDLNGGFLGREWFDVTPCEDNYSIRNLTVGAGSGNMPALTVNGTFGGMIHTVTGRMQVVDTVINGMSVTGNNTGNDGLLINNGYHALIEIDGYTIQGLSTSGVNDFSEIVGRNIGTGPTDNNYTDYTNGGIVNIISKEFETGSKAYTDQQLPAATVSGKVRYYYNLFGDTLAGESAFLSNQKLDGSNIVIENADQMLIWHLNQYMNDTIRARYLAPYFKDGNVPEKNGNVTIKGRINLANESYYPTPVGGLTISGEGALIEFNAKDIEDQADTGRKPSSQGEHYMMHSSLFLSKEGTVTVQGSTPDKGAVPQSGADYLTLSGTVSDAGEHSGALFSKEISGEKNIYRIQLKDLYIYNYSGDHNHGLLIAKVNDNSTIDMSWIRTEYSDSGMKAASALIGVVGRADTVTTKGTSNISIEFTNIKVDDKVSGIFQNATLIDQFYYTDDTAINKGRVRYLFTEEAAKGTKGTEYDPFLDDVHGHNDYSTTGEYITLGSELGYGIEYWNQDGDIHKELLSGDNWVDYLPYVCTHPESKEPEVNPKISDIIRGCGTYEDPYVLDNAKQILALSRYLTNANDVKYLTGWKINKIGNNDTFCDGTHEESDQISYGQAGFPTQDQLRQAYYLIEKDIDLSSLAYVTDRNIAQEFVGLGTEDKPFAGVIIGRKEDGSVPTITLPRKKESNYATNFGLIQYAKGAVVKDLTITGNQDVDSLDTTLTDCIRVKENAGAVFACVLGGDNIIDHVTVSSRIMPVRDAAAVDTEVAVGGYVGTVRQGSVILRNLSTNSLKDFQCLSNASGNLEPVTPADYPYVSGMIGKVENGFVMYDGDYDNAVLRHSESGIDGIYSNADLLPISQTYDIIAAGAAGMEEAKNNPMNILRDSNGDFSCEIQTPAQLQVVSMAINSDAFSVYYDGGGYDKNAVCRKAQYDKVGSCIVSDSDYLAAIQKDDGSYWYPYIYDYFTFDGTKASASVKDSSGFYHTLELYSGTGNNGKTDYRSQLNAVTGDISASMSYSLVSRKEYDLSVYGRGFRGLGATYRVFEKDRTAYTDSDLTVKADSVYSDFRADFDGKGATVKAVMINDYDHTIHTLALFNDLIDVDAKNTYTIQNLVVTGVFNNSYADRNLAGEINYRNDRAAAVVGMMRRSWLLTDITVKDATVKSDGHAAGIVAWINPGSERADQKSYELVNCTVTGKTSITTAGGSSGGIVGVMAPAMPGTVKELALTMTNCTVSGSEDGHVTISNNGNGLLSAADNNDQYRYGRGRTGGLIGFIGKRTDRDINGNINAAYDDRAKVIINVNIKGPDNGNTVEYVEVNGIDSTGGILGEYFGYSIENEMFLTNQADTLTIESVTIFESTVTSKNRNETQYSSFGAGGIAGKIGRATGCKISDSKVLHTDVKATYFAMPANINIMMTAASAGGVIGSVYYGSRVTLSNITVEGKVDAEGTPESEISSVTCDAGGLVGRNINPTNGSTNPERTSFDIVDSKVSYMNILSDNRTESAINEDRASGTSAGMVGGMVGRADCVKITVRRIAEENSTVENCVIRTGKDGNAGGILGQTYNGSNYTFEGIRVSDSKIGHNADFTEIGFYGAGGIIGKIGAANGSNPTNLATGTLRKVEVSSCDIFGRMTGGLFGYVYRTVNIGNIWNSNDDDILIKENNIFGRFAGGVIGCNDNSVTKTCFEHVTVEGNRILALWNGDCYSGGFCGREYLNGVNNDYNQITIKDNWIMSCNYSGNQFNADQASGGMFGFIGQNAELYAFETKLQDNHIGYYEYQGTIDRVLKAGKDQMEVITKEVQSLGMDESTSPKLLGKNNEIITDMPALTEDTIIDYTKRFGNMIGTYSGANMHVYFIKPTVTYTTGYEGVRPVVDVGALNPGTAGDTLLASPYDYRQNIHVVYFEPDESGNSAAGVWESVTGSTRDNLFSQINIEEIIEEYQNAKSAAGTTDQLLDAYRLNLKIENDGRSSVEDVYSTVYYGPDETNTDGYRSPIQVNGKELPMIVLDARNGTADQLMHSVLAMLTGSGGVLNSGERNQNNVYDHGLFKITKITCERMEIENGVMRSVTGEDPSLTYNSTGTAAGNNGHKEFIYTRKFDTADSTGGTFTMVTITYGKETYTPIAGTANCRPQVTVKIPVFVMERLTIDTYIKLVEGAAYDVEEAKEKGIEKDPMLATDSSYTMYVEYIYGEARNSFSTEENPLSIEKTIGRTKMIDNKETNVPFPAGTIFTLIDVCDSNRVYYYEVKGDETEAISYTAFTDASGKPYENKPIHGKEGLEVHEGDTDLFVTNGESYQDVAVERFLIVVDAPKDHLESGTGDISNYHAAPVLTDDISKRTTLTEHTDLVVTIQEGPKIGFLTENMETTITGNIDREVHLTADGQFRIKADEAYWLRVLNSPDSVIDSANHGKFLDVGFYLTADSREGERIPLPDNTNVSIYLERLVPLPGEIQPDKNIGSFINTAEIYLYKDGKLQFPLDALKELIEREMNDSDNKTRGEVTIHFTIDLGFELADLSEYVDDKYGVHLELLRTGEAAYPAGGDIIDIYEDDCYGTRPSELACAIETKDLMQLGINLYDNQAKPQEMIDFTFKLDFTGVWDEHNKQANQERADAYYTVTYRILEKTNRDGDPVYRPYTGNNLEIVLVNNPENAGDQSGAGSLPQLSAGKSSVGNEINSRYVTYRFAYHEIENGSKGESIKQTPLVILRDVQLVVKDTANLGITDLTNYKIQASVMISDMPVNDIDDRVNPALSDFFVFTIANLKTDLDY